MEGEEDQSPPFYLKNIDYSELTKVDDMIEKDKELSLTYTLAGILKNEDIEVNNKPSLKVQKQSFQKSYKNFAGQWYKQNPDRKYDTQGLKK